MASPVREGDILAGKYKVERVIAQGGMGVVVAAMHQQLEQRVALKFLLPEGMENEATVGRFLREAKAAVRLRSEHVARVLDVGTAETGSPYIVMEYLEGKDLSGVLEEEGRLPIRSAVTYVLQAAEAVAEAHALGIVHRDLKPANLFLTKRADGTPCVKVLDFGISKLTNAQDMNLTKTSAVMGTPFYMAPEQLQSSKNVDLRSDIWSLGMILYELLTGFVAFQRDTLPGLCSAILFEPVPPPRNLLPTIPEELEAVVIKALEKDPANRQQTLAVFATELADFVAGGEQLATRVRRVLGVEARPSSNAPEDPSSRELSSVARIEERVSTPSPQGRSESTTVALTARSPATPASNRSFTSADEPRVFEPRVEETRDVAPRNRAWLPVLLSALAAALVVAGIVAASRTLGRNVEPPTMAATAGSASHGAESTAASAKPTASAAESRGAEFARTSDAEIVAAKPEPSVQPSATQAAVHAPAPVASARPATRPRPSAEAATSENGDLYGPRK